MREIDLLDYLSTLGRGKDPVFYMANPGNAGDSLIACATLQLFKRFGIHYTMVNQAQPFLKGQVVIYGGGGNLIPHYHQANKFLSAVHSEAKKLIILPHTIEGNEDLLSQFGANVDILCREPLSYAHVFKNASRSNVSLTHDAGFYLNAAEALSLSKMAAWYQLLKNAGSKNALERLIKLTRDDLKIEIIYHLGRKTLHCFRLDKEKTDLPIPKDNMDLSRVLDYGTHNESINRAVTHLFLRYLNRFECIQTNRLHVAIAAAHLNKRTMFYRNSTYKNEAVYRHSMLHRYPHVTWMG